MSVLWLLSQPATTQALVGLAEYTFEHLTQASDCIYAGSPWGTVLGSILCIRMQ